MYVKIYLYTMNFFEFWWRILSLLRFIVPILLLYIKILFSSVPVKSNKIPPVPPMSGLPYRYPPQQTTQYHHQPGVGAPAPTMSSQRFCLRWNNHQSNLLSVFDQLLHDESFVDVTLAVEGQLLKAHKMVLSACSPYFQALFINHPDKHPIVILKDVPYADMRSLLDFMYRGEVSVFWYYSLFFFCLHLVLDCALKLYNLICNMHFLKYSGHRCWSCYPHRCFSRYPHRYW